MTARFPGLVIRDWRTRIVHDHPRLFPDARPVATSEGLFLSCPGWPDVPDGWRTVVETACHRLEEAIAAEPDGGLTILDLKEKHGTLRLLVGSDGLGDEAQAAVELAVDLAEARSAHLCDVCGRLGHLSVQANWYATRCEEHSLGHDRVQERGEDIDVSVRLVGGRRIRVARRYDFATDSFSIVGRLGQ